MSRLSFIQRLYAKKMPNALEFNYDALQAPRIMDIFTLYDIESLYKIATSLKYNGNIEKKYELIDAIMRNRGFIKAHSGTNRVVYNFLEDKSFVAKVAVDKVGLKDSPAEFRNQNYFKPFCCKIFEVTTNGVLAFVERVNPITSLEEFASVSDDIFNLMVTKIIGKYVVDDLGVSKFMNYGVRDGSNGIAFGPVIIDFPYAYELDGNKLLCRNKLADKNGNPFICGGEIDYDDGLNNLYCTKCGKSYRAEDLMKNPEIAMTVFTSEEGAIYNMRAKIVGADGKVKYDSGFASDTLITAKNYKHLPIFQDENFKTNRTIVKKIKLKKKKKDLIKKETDMFHIKSYNAACRRAEKITTNNNKGEEKIMYNNQPIRNTIYGGYAPEIVNSYDDIYKKRVTRVKRTTPEPEEIGSYYCAKENNTKPVETKNIQHDDTIKQYSMDNKPSIMDESPKPYEPKHQHMLKNINKSDMPIANSGYDYNFIKEDFSDESDTSNKPTLMDKFIENNKNTKYEHGNNEYSKEITATNVIDATAFDYTNKGIVGEGISFNVCHDMIKEAGAVEQILVDANLGLQIHKLISDAKCYGTGNDDYKTLIMNILIDGMVYRVNVIPDVWFNVDNEGTIDTPISDDPPIEGKDFYFASDSAIINSNCDSETVNIDMASIDTTDETLDTSNINENNNTVDEDSSENEENVEFTTDETTADESNDNNIDVSKETEMATEPVINETMSEDNVNSESSEEEATHETTDTKSISEEIVNDIDNGPNNEIPNINFISLLDFAKVISVRDHTRDEVHLADVMAKSNNGEYSKRFSDVMAGNSTEKFVKIGDCYCPEDDLPDNYKDIISSIINEYNGNNVNSYTAENIESKNDSNEFDAAEDDNNYKKLIDDDGKMISSSETNNDEPIDATKNDESDNESIDNTEEEIADNEEMSDINEDDDNTNDYIEYMNSINIPNPNKAGRGNRFENNRRYDKKYDDDYKG